MGVDVLPQKRSGMDESLLSCADTLPVLVRFYITSPNLGAGAEIPVSGVGASHKSAPTSPASGRPTSAPAPTERVEKATPARSPVPNSTNGRQQVEAWRDSHSRTRPCGRRPTCGPSSCRARAAATAPLCRMTVVPLALQARERLEQRAPRVALLEAGDELLRARNFFWMPRSNHEAPNPLAPVEGTKKTSRGASNG